MLSGNGETQAVMKGITHGACDYLLKPVRIEELRNIWQHVVRRRKFDGRSQSNLENGGEDGQKSSQINHEGEQGAVDRNGKLKKKRKEQNGEEEEDSDENPRENEDPSAQKKPRVVWSVELHRKFVAAVNQLGIDSKNSCSWLVVAVPCSISWMGWNDDNMLVLCILFQRPFLSGFSIL